MESDQSLLDRWRGGDEAGGRELFARYFTQLYRFFANKCAEPDEMVQGTFFAIIRARDQFAGRSQFRTYLFTIARHELYRHLRTLRREREFDPNLSSIAEIVTTAGSQLARNEDHRRLCAALRTLPVEQQTLLELHYWEELDATALAEVFEVDAQAIRTRLYRARNALRDAIVRAEAAPAAVLTSAEDLDTWVRTTGS
ncbi:MAG: sigma-70 family RNA polymerase sigma factor [Deltaproteobacteria bacterium]|nr:sigma-70 family RNA polymerase sigma factor [Deltaproteobacteria bacterium]